MQKLSANEIRSKWLQFFHEKNHLVVEGKSLIPVNDPSLLWVNSGVATLKRFFSGIENPPSPRLVNSQRSIRTNDIENVGVTSRHHTLFEMLGNFSIGDYFKKEAITYGFELLTRVFEIPPEKLYITVFEEDTETYQTWVSLGIDESHIIKCGRDRNFWDIGQGPCGPCTEIHFDRGEKYDPECIGEKLIFEDIENDRYVEIWNIVFSEFNNDGENNYTPLIRKNIDTGAGLERLCCIFQETITNFETDLFKPVIDALQAESEKKYDENAYFTKNAEQQEINRNYRVIVDHLRANVFAIADGAVPGNKERGSILRRLIRRTIICAKNVSLKNNFVKIAVEKIIDVMKDFYPYLVNQQSMILEVIEKEKKQFETTLEKGLKLFYLEIAKAERVLNTEATFKLVDTYGFPIELITEIAEEKGIHVDLEGFNALLEEHRKNSRANLEVKAMSTQASDLIQFTTPTEFIYNTLKLDSSQIVKIFNEKFEAVSKINSIAWLALDKTVFYATSGGQIHDRGIIQIGENKFEVEDAIKAPNGQTLVCVDLDNIWVSAQDNFDVKQFVDAVFRANVSKNHTAEHILEHVMNKNIDSSIKQEGAFKTDTYFTFDYKLPYRLSDDQLSAIEEMVNEIILSAKPVTTDLKKYEDLQDTNVVGHFAETYKKIKGEIRVVKIDGVNYEICGGTHVYNTSEIEKFMIVENTLKGSNIWRIKAITSNETTSKYIDDEIEAVRLKVGKIKEKVQLFEIKDEKLNSLLDSFSFHSSTDNLIKIKNQLVETEAIFNELLTQAKKSRAEMEIALLSNQEKSFSNSKKVVYFVTHHKDPKNILSAMNNIINENKELSVIFLNNIESKVQYFVMSTPEQKFNCREIVKQINILTSGTGGGTEFLSQGACEVKNIEQLLEFITSL